MEFQYDFGQVYLFDSDLELPGEAFGLAQDAAEDGIGVSGGVVDILMPRKDNFHAHLEVFEEEAPHDLAEWEHAVEFDLDVPSGVIVLEAAGGAGEVRLKVRPGKHRILFAGRNFAEAKEWNYETDSPPDEYAMWMWPRESDSDPKTLKNSL